MIAVAEKELNCFCFWPNVQADTFTSYCLHIEIIKYCQTGRDCVVQAPPPSWALFKSLFLIHIDGRIPLWCITMEWEDFSV